MALSPVIWVSVNIVHYVSEDMPDSFQLEADDIANWATEKKLKLNPGKTQLLTISRNKKCGTSIHMDGHKLE